MRWATAIVCSVILCTLAYLFWGLSETTLPDPPTEDIYVADFAQMVQTDDKKKILAIGEELDNRFGAQLVVVTIDTLGDEDIESYANRLFRAWGIGNAEKDNGVLLLIAREDRKFRVEVGYGLEGAITDGYAGEVLDGMKSGFRNGDYSPCILEACQKLAQKIYVGYGADPPENVLPAASPEAAEASAEEEWTMEDYIFCGIFVLVVVAFAMGCVFFVQSLASLLLVIVLGVLWYAANVILFVLSLGHWGTLSFSKCFAAVNSCMGTSGSSSDGDSSGNSHSYGGGSSGGGGASGGW